MNVSIIISCDGCLNGLVNSKLGLIKNIAIAVRLIKIIRNVFERKSDALLSILFITLLPSFTTYGRLKKLESRRTK